EGQPQDVPLIEPGEEAAQRKRELPPDGLGGRLSPTLAFRQHGRRTRGAGGMAQIIGDGLQEKGRVLAPARRREVELYLSAVPVLCEEFVEAHPPVPSLPGRLQRACQGRGRRTSARNRSVVRA